GPPMPVEKRTPVRAWSTVGSPASCHACFAEASANWVARSVRLTSFAVIQGSVSNPCTSPAMRTEKVDASKEAIGLIPERPAFSASQSSPAPTPTGVTAPRPVTTMRRGTLGRDPELRGDELDRLTDRLHALHLLLGDRDAELLLEGEHRLDEVERVRVQVLLEPGLGRHLVLRDRQVVGEDRAHLVLEFPHVHTHPPLSLESRVPSF